VREHALVHPDVDDRLITGGKVVSAAAAIGSPVLGLVGAAFFESLAHYSAKKTADLLNDIEKRLRALEATGILSVNELARNESFLELLLTACRVAQHTARKEKIERVKNAVTNCARCLPEPSQIDSFFHLFDQLTENHFLILQVLIEHLEEFAAVRSIKDAHCVFLRFCSQLTEDAFGHYFSDLRYRRLIRVSEIIADNDGLKESPPSLGLSYEEKSAPVIIISDIARQLVDYTKPCSSTPSAFF
jgi:hypothetical protein